MMKRHPKWGLALGGGGARGIAHIGVLKILQRENLIPDVITGTSIGALVGAAFACRPDANALEERLYEVLAPDTDENKPLKQIARLNWVEKTEATLLNRLLRSVQKEIFVGMALFRNGVWSMQELRNSVSAFLPDIDVTETRIRFVPLAVDLLSGESLLINRGPIIEAVMASCAVPGFMPPVPFGDALLMDGGLADPIPARAARDCGAKKVISVDVGIQLCHERSIRDGIDAIDRATEIMGYHLGNDARSRSDLLISPLQDHCSWTDFEGYRELIHQGEVATEAALDDIDGLLRGNIRWYKRFGTQKRKHTTVNFLSSRRKNDENSKTADSLGSAFGPFFGRCRRGPL
jgi:NTE family protein